jgi:multidrug resistance efflux pump
MVEQHRKDVDMAEAKPGKPTPSQDRYERLLRGEITSKQYVKSLQREARSQRASVKSAKTRRRAA